MTTESRATLAEGAVVGPTLEDVEDLCEQHEFGVEGYASIECLQGLINDAIARYGTAAPRPIPVAKQMSAWQPIESAPRDGTEVLGSDSDRIEIVSLDQGHWGKGWFDRNDEQFYPVWWIPLPEQPSISDGEFFPTPIAPIEALGPGHAAAMPRPEATP